MRFLSSNVDIFPKKPPKKIPTHINKQPLEERKKNANQTKDPHQKWYCYQNGVSHLQN